MTYREFMPQVELNSFRLKYERGDTSCWSKSDQLIYRSAEGFMQNSGKSNFYGTLHQSADTLLNLNFNTNIPDLENEGVRILQEYGEITIPTTKGLYHLKQFCVFSAYSQLQSQPVHQKDYYITLNGSDLASFSIPAR